MCVFKYIEKFYDGGESAVNLNEPLKTQFWQVLVVCKNTSKNFVVVLMWPRQEFLKMGESGTLCFSSHYSCLQNILRATVKCKDMVTKDIRQWAIEGGHDQY